MYFQLFMVLFFYPYASKDIVKTKTLLAGIVPDIVAGIRVYLGIIARLLSSGPPSRVYKVQYCKVEILISA